MNENQLLPVTLLDRLLHWRVYFRFVIIKQVWLVSQRYLALLNYRTNHNLWLFIFQYHKVFFFISVSLQIFIFFWLVDSAGWGLFQLCKIHWDALTGLSMCRISPLSQYFKQRSAVHKNGRSAGTSSIPNSKCSW